MGLVTTLAGGKEDYDYYYGYVAWGSSNGLGTNAGFKYPCGITSPDSNGNIYVADHYNHLVRKIDRYT